MSTLRQQLGAAALARLAGIAGVASLLPPPGRALDATELTALIVEVGAADGRLVTRASSERLMARVTRLNVTALILDGSTADAAMETLWGEVETRFGADWTFGGIVKSIGGLTLGPKAFAHFAERRYLVAQPAMEQTFSLDCILYAQFGVPDVVR